MATFWNTKFTKRDYECTTVVAIKAEALPKGCDPTIWKRNGHDAIPTTGGLQHLDTITQGGQRFERWGYL
jgi:hypothetical protein